MKIGRKPKLSEEQIKELRALSKFGKSHRDLALIFGLSKSAVGYIIGHKKIDAAVLETRRRRIHAARHGQERFVAAHECNNGHIGERYTQSGECVQCVIGKHERRKKRGKPLTKETSELKWWEIVERALRATSSVMEVDRA